MAWHRTSAKVVSIIERYGPGPGISYEIDVEYTYELDGRQLTGTQLTLGYDRFSAREASELKIQFFPGGTAEVYFDPRNPADSVLVRDRPAWWLWVVGAGLLAADVGYVLWIG